MDGVLADRYRVERKLGEGGMAEVFLVHDALEDRPLALKLLKPGEANSRDYFMHEFRVLARLEHPNLVRVYDFGTTAVGDDDLPYYTCEFLRGVDLFNATKNLDFEGLYDVVRQVLEALSYILVMTAAMTSDEEQIDEFLENLRDDLKKRQSKIEKNSAEKRRTRRRERLTESFSNWLGPLSADQRQQIHRLADNSQTSSEQWLEYRTRWVDELERALRSRQDSNMFKLQVERLIRDPQSLRTPEHQSHVESDQQLWVAHLIQLHRGLSEKQRTHLQKELEDLIADIRYIISQENE